MGAELEQKVMIHPQAKKIKIGLIARADNTGIGVQTWEFYRHMKPDKTLVVDISALNQNKQYPERFDGEGVTFCQWPQESDFIAFLEGLDLVFVVESPYDYNFFKLARERNVRTVLQYNWEYIDYLGKMPYPQPDLFASPTPWHFEDLPFHNKMILPVPVDRERCKFKKRMTYNNFLHIAGKPVSHDRNGTETVLKAVKHVTSSEFRLIVRVQDENYIPEWKKLLEPTETRVEFVAEDTENYWDIYDQGNIMLMPRRYAGLCLPVQEALSTGMPVIMTDVSPNNELLPKQWLIECEKIGEFMCHVMVDIHESKAEALANRVNKWIANGLNGMLFNNALANNIASELDWRKWVNRYNEVFEQLCKVKQ